MSNLDNINPPSISKELGRLHPINQTKDYLLKLLADIGFEEVHGPEIETEEFIEDEKIIRVRAVIMVERDSQKGIIIGHKGAALKRVGIQSRADLEKFFGKQIHLETYVKVNKDWRSSAYQLKRFGYNQK